MTRSDAHPRTGGAGPDTGRRRWVAFTVRAVLTASILGALLLWLPLDQLLAAMGRVGPRLWIFCLIMVIVGHVVVALKWRILLRVVGLATSRLRALQAHGAGLFASVWLPSLIGGDVVRVAVVARRQGALVEAASGGIADRLADAAVLVLLAALGATVVPEATSETAVTIIAVAAGVLLLALAGAFVFAAVSEPEALPDRFAPLFGRFKAAVASLTESRWETSLVLSLSLSVQLLFVLLNAALGRAIGIDIPLSGWMMAWPLAKLAALLPISLAGWGVREAALAAFLAPLGVDPTLAVAQSLVWETVLLALALTAGAGSLLARRLSPVPDPTSASGGDAGVLVGEQADSPDDQGG